MPRAGRRSISRAPSSVNPPSWSQPEAKAFCSFQVGASTRTPSLATRSNGQISSPNEETPSIASSNPTPCDPTSPRSRRLRTAKTSGLDSTAAWKLATCRRASRKRGSRIRLRRLVDGANLKHDAALLQLLEPARTKRILLALQLREDELLQQIAVSVGDRDPVSTTHGPQPGREQPGP